MNLDRMATAEGVRALALIYSKEVSRGSGPGDPGSRGPAMPDPETFPYEWLGVRQYISMPRFMSVIGKLFESCREYLKECHKIIKIIYLFYQIILLTL